MVDAAQMRTLLRADLTVAMRSRQSETVTALRTAMAAIDNAEAVVARDAPIGSTSAFVAGARAGVGSSEASRRHLTVEELRSLLHAQMDERTVEADRYEAHGKHESAQRLRREAEALTRYVGLLPAASE